MRPRLWGSREGGAFVLPCRLPLMTNPADWMRSTSLRLDGEQDFRSAPSPHELGFSWTPMTCLCVLKWL